MDTIAWKSRPVVKQKWFSTVGGRDAISYQAEFDWIIGDRWQGDTERHCYGDPDSLPDTVFVTCLGFQFFYTIIFPHLLKRHHRFVLVIGDHDMTVPMQVDVRYDKHAVMTMGQWNDLLSNACVAHIYVCHLDVLATGKVSPLPVGFNPHELRRNNLNQLNTVVVSNNVATRPLTMRACCRIRSGHQWDARRQVKDLCQDSWSDFCDWGSIPHSFFDVVQQYSFLLCVQGGGIDPNPKVFSAILCGTIPIIKRFPNCDALYAALPVVMVEDWTPESITLDKLHAWREQHARSFCDTQERSRVLEKLTMDYWMGHIRSKRCQIRPNPTLADYHNIHNDEDIYVLASGKSFDYFPAGFFQGRVSIGINHMTQICPCTYGIYKEVPEQYLVTHHSGADDFVLFLSAGQWGGNNSNNRKAVEKLIGVSPRNIVIFEHPKNALKVPTQLPADDSLVVSHSTITSAIHLAAHMGARCVVLVGHDCGLLDGVANCDGYQAFKEAHADAANPDLNKYKTWLKGVGPQTAQLRSLIKHKYNCDVVTMSPFIGFGMEGHKYTSS